MSAKSSKPGKKISVPREMTAIQADFQQQATQAGHLQYQIAVFEAELVLLNDRMRSLSNEANARKELDVKSEIKETIQEAKDESQA